MYQVQVKVAFRYGHRLVAPYEGKCSNVHGELGEAIFVFNAGELDSKGFVLDFGVVKKNIKTWIDEKLDHAYIYNENDEIGKYLTEKGLKTFNIGPENPTAENIAKLLYNTFEPVSRATQNRVCLHKVGIMESTPDSIAWYL